MAAQEHAKLVASTARGDRAAWGVLYRTYLPLVLRWCVRATGDRELAADLSSEVFAEALLAAHRYRPDAGPVGAWLIGIAHNKLRETRRRSRVEDSARRRLGIEREPISDLDLERVDELVSTDSRLEALLADLPVEHRRALVARVIEERPYEEIAAALDCSEAVVRQRVSRGLKSLRTQLESR